MQRLQEDMRRLHEDPWTYLPATRRLADALCQPQPSSSPLKARVRTVGDHLATLAKLNSVARRYQTHTDLARLDCELGGVLD